MLYHDGHNDLNGLAETVESVSARLLHEKQRGRIDGIVVTGFSGALVGIPVSLSVGLPLFIVRKESEKSHAWDRIINVQKLHYCEKVLFLDDLCDSGATAKYVADTIRAECNIVPVGIYSYRFAKYERDVLSPSPAIDWTRDFSFSDTIGAACTRYSLGIDGITGKVRSVNA